MDGGAVFLQVSRFLPDLPSFSFRKDKNTSLKWASNFFQHSMVVYAATSTPKSKITIDLSKFRAARAKCCIMHGNTRHYSAYLVKESLNDEDISILVKPTRSPDLNSVKYSWSVRQEGLFGNINN
jgi:hypothetical protein